MSFLAIEPAREEDVAFSPPYLAIEGVYVVPVDAPFGDASEVDRPGVTIGVKEGSAYDLYLTRTLEHVEVVRGSEGTTVLVDRATDVGAGIRQPVTAFVGDAQKSGCSSPRSCRSDRPSASPGTGQRRGGVRRRGRLRAGRIRLRWRERARGRTRTRPWNARTSVVRRREQRDVQRRPQLGVVERRAEETLDLGDRSWRTGARCSGVDAAADLRPACSTTARRVRDGAGRLARAARASSRSAKARTPGVVGQQRRAGRAGGRPRGGALRAAVTRVGRGQHVRRPRAGCGRPGAAPRPACRQRRRPGAGSQRRGPGGRSAGTGSTAGRQRDQDADLGVEGRDQTADAEPLGRPQARAATSRRPETAAAGGAASEREADVRPACSGSPASATRRRVSASLGSRRAARAGARGGPAAAGRRGCGRSRRCMASAAAARSATATSRSGGAAPSR